MNKDFKQYMKSLDVNFFTTNSDVKASVVERFNRTLKEKMWRFFTKNGTYKYIDILPDLLYNYNHSYHRTIKMAPSAVSKANEKEIYEKVYSIKKKPAVFKFKVGDKVRISRFKETFEKGYTGNWSEEIFTVKLCIPRDPPVYKIQDTLGEEIEGIFYEQELQKVDITDGYFVVEKVLKTRRGPTGNKEYFVKWKGYPSKFNSWVNQVIKV